MGLVTCLGVDSACHWRDPGACSCVITLSVGVDSGTGTQRAGVGVVSVRQDPNFRLGI